MFSILAPALRVNLFVTKYMRNVILGVSGERHGAEKVYSCARAAHVACKKKHAGYKRTH